MKIVLAYSGGLDTSIILHWLKKTYKAEIIAFTGNVGLDSELDGLKEKALKTGASKIYIQDLRGDFVKNGIFRLIKANARYQRKYLLGTSIARPFIAKAMADIAIKEKAQAVAHGATGKGNDQVRFEAVFKQFTPHMKIIAPWREWNLKSRDMLIDYAAKNNIPVPVSKSKPYSSDRNIMHISYEGGVLEDPYYEPPEDMFKLTVSPEKAPETPEYMEITFKNGEPCRINGKNLKPVDLLLKANEIGGRHGIGRVDIVEDRLVGMKSRGVYETPGASLLMEAHEALESITLDKDTLAAKCQLGDKYAELTYNGLWFSPFKEAIDAFIDYTQKNVTGTVRLKLFKGACQVTGRKAERSLYDPELATFNEDEIYNQQDAMGFINLFTLPLKVRGIVNKKNK
ncbi:MAG TPA: argininosuccinate synthase [Spirochaetia bacterium]|nr:argininosuccinate synthase [Spirochaetia bacterium]